MFGRRIFALLSFGALGGCHSCANDHPYVPAEIEAGTVDAAVGAPAAAADAGLEAAVELAAGTSKWQGEGLTIDAANREIALILVRDFDNDGKKDALAVLRPKLADRKPGASTGQIVYLHGGDPGHTPTVVGEGPPLGTWPACVATARLERTGGRALYAELGSKCPKAVSTRGIFVVRITPSSPRVSFDATVTDPKDASPLDIYVDTNDRDKDGLDDVTLHLLLDGLPADLAFFDRPAGPSRDPEEPEASLKTIASRITSKATKTKEMPAAVEQMRMLYRAMCEEGGAPRITGIHGAEAISCGTSKALEDAGIAEVRALASEGDVFGAYFAAELAQASPATKTTNRKFEVDKYLALAAPTVEAKSFKTLATAVDAPLDAQPQWGPLAFESSGKLLVRKGKTVARVDLENGDEVVVPDSPAWSSEVLSPDGKRRWIEAYQACEGTAFRASFAILETDQMVEASLPFAPRLGRGCTGHGDPVLAQPIAWGNRGLEAMVAGRPVLIKDDQGTTLLNFLDEIAPIGSPRAHGSSAFVAAVPNALLANVEGKWSNVKSEARPGELRACTIADDGAHIACVRAGRVVVLTR